MIEVNVKEEEEKVKGFPKLMKSDNSIILFHENKKGVVVSSWDSSIYKIGYYSDDWNMDYFEDYNKELTIKNK